MEDLDRLEWQPMEGLSQYEISEYGHIRRTIRGRSVPKGKLLSHQVDKDGYHRVILHVDSDTRISKSVHFLVAYHFIGKPLEGQEAHHIDHIKDNNHYSNLAWVTHQENITALWKHNGGERRLSVPRGSQTVNHVLVEADIPKIFELVRQGKGQREIALMFDVSHVAIGHVLRGKTWSHVETDRTLPRRKTYLGKLKAEDIPVIRKMFRNGQTYRRIAAHFDVSFHAIGCVLRGVTFKDIPEDDDF